MPIEVIHTPPVVVVVVVGAERRDDDVRYDYRRDTKGSGSSS
jgi:hypothetical protein